MRTSTLSIRRSLRRMSFGAMLVLLVQSGFGVAVNLYTTIPKDHGGAQPSNYVTGSFHSVVWATTHGATSLVIHTVLGLLLALMSISIVARAMAVRDGWVTSWSIVGLLFIVGAGFNGASFLDYNKDVSSLIMALLAFGAIGCYATVLYMLATERR